jgi:hypothetical protein
MGLKGCFGVLEPLKDGEDGTEYDRFDIGFACCRCRKITGFFLAEECEHCGHSRCEIPDRKLYG